MDSTPMSGVAERVRRCGDPGCSCAGRSAALPRGIFLLLALAALLVPSRPGEAQTPVPTLSAIREGWGWGVVVVPPPDGWRGRRGASIKGALRLAEREIALTHEGIHGKEIIFLYAGTRDLGEVRARLPEWRRMKVAAILSFADEETGRFLLNACGEEGPPLLLSDGENLSLRRGDGSYLPYAFALGLYWTYRAGAIAQDAVPPRSRERVAVFFDPYDPVMERGARRTDLMLGRLGGRPMLLGTAGPEGSDPAVRMGEILQDGVRTVVSWQDQQSVLAMASVLAGQEDSVRLYHGGGPAPLLLGAAGVRVADQWASLREGVGKKGIGDQVWRMFGLRVPDPAAATVGYALGRWIIGALQDAGGAAPIPLAEALSRVGEFPLMGEVLAADPVTHRPLARSVGILAVKDRRFVYERSVRVLSRACEE